jgi:hypothetical protein
MEIVWPAKSSCFPLAHNFGHTSVGKPEVREFLFFISIASYIPLESEDEIQFSELSMILLLLSNSIVDSNVLSQSDESRSHRPLNCHSTSRELLVFLPRL